MSKRDLAPLRDELLDLQFKLRESKKAALALIITGAPAAGRSETINELLSWLDPKYIRVHAFGAADIAERRRPPMWRYWQTVPMRGRMVFYFAGWYADLVAEARGQDGKPSRTKRRLQSILQLEAMLAADGVHVLKIHLKVDRNTQGERLKRLCSSKLTRWRVTKEDHWFAKHYARAQRMAKRYIQHTSQPAAPWQVIDGSDEERRLYEVAVALKEALIRALDTESSAAPAAAHAAAPATSAKEASEPRLAPRTPAKATKVDDDEYETQLESLQGRLALLVRRARFRKHALVLAFEGMDAAGKGGAIRRITHALDARQYQVVPVSAPTQEEAAHPYLWRFWKHVPECGEITIFDRSWYGRVLVERVRGFTPQPDWQRAYSEIAEFEQQLSEFGIVVVKFWMSVSKDEQLKRFKAREEDQLKRFKVDDEDWKNRELYEGYQDAAREMMSRTHRRDAPWFIIDADVKKHARLEVLRATCEEIERRLG
jgi:AMP-polyphosphate phosphotransferase